MFVVEDTDTGQVYYTRDGSFQFDSTGHLVYSDGKVVQGYSVDDGGNLGPLSDVRVSYENFPPKQTTTVSTTVNLNSDAEDGDTFQTTVNIYDSLGNEIPVTVTYTKTATANEWDWVAEIPAEYGTISAGGSGTVTFDSSGELVSGTDPVWDLTLTNGAAAQSVTWDLYDDAGDSNGLMTQYSGESLMSAKEQDGYAAGELIAAEIDESGFVVCTYSNSQTRAVYQIALADFTNYHGLEKSDGNLYIETIQSGQAILGRASVGKMGDVAPGAEEMSTVDLATEMANLITAQTAYKACSRSFTVTNEILEVLVNL
jgi:flagellar hook protein FlgE